MQKIKLTLTAQAILTLDAGTHEAIREGGNLYVLVQQEDGGAPVKDEPKQQEVTKAPASTAKATTTATTAPTKARVTKEVVDDTKKEPAKTTSRSRPAKVEEPAQEELVEIVDWNVVNDNELVLVKLDMGDDKEASEKIWEATITGWKVPKGGKEEKLHVLFTEDQQEDYLRENDRIFEWTQQL